MTETTNAEPTDPFERRRTWGGFLIFAGLAGAVITIIVWASGNNEDSDLNVLRNGTPFLIVTLMAAAMFLGGIVLIASAPPGIPSRPATPPNWQRHTRLP